MAISADAHKVLVTGAGGFVGKWTVDNLVRRLSPTAVIAPRFSIDSPTSLDISNRDAVRAAVSEARPTAVIHLAAVANPTEARADPVHAWQVNVIGTLNLALAVMEFSPEARFIFIGSSEAYGASFIGNSRLSETALLQPTTCYGSTKAAADLMIGANEEGGAEIDKISPVQPHRPRPTGKLRRVLFRGADRAHRGRAARAGSSRW